MYHVNLALAKVTGVVFPQYDGNKKISRK